MQNRIPLTVGLSVILVASAMAPAPAGAWIEKKLQASDGVSGDYFGGAVSISGNEAFVGAGNDDDDGNSSGSVYVFQKIGGLWTEVDKLTASDGAEFDFFGYSGVSVSGDRAIVGAYGDDDKGEASGSVYIFEKLGGIWTEVDKLTASDGAEGDFFGYSVSISGNQAIVGAHKESNFSGAAYMLEKIGDTWTEVDKLTPDDAPVFQRLGYSVSISGNQAAAGAYQDNDAGTRTGSLYVFEKIGGTWTQKDKLTASDAVYDEGFGYSVTISGDRLIVGAWHDDNENGDFSGSAYVFEKIGGTWTEVDKILAGDGDANDQFGNSASISGDRAVVGAFSGHNDSGVGSGATYLFEKIGDTWTETAKFSDPDGSLGDWFGYSVSISADQFIVGAMLGDNSSGVSTGAAYVYAPGQGGPFAPLGPENGTPHVAPPIFEWAPGEYDVFRVYLVLSLFGTYYTIPTHWMVAPVFDLSSYDPLWDYVDDTWALWVVFGANITTGDWDVTDPWAFLKVAP